MIRDVYAFQNGMCMVFDEKGQQMPDYQGPTDEVRDKILADATPETIFHSAVWGGSDRIVSRKQWGR
jgi:hypothetical protein